jgi:hypothetical protein
MEVSTIFLRIFCYENMVIDMKRIPRGSVNEEENEVWRRGRKIIHRWD